MANGAPKQSEEEFGGATGVMESGLLRVLKQSSKSSDTGGWRAIADEMKVDVLAQPPAAPEVAAPAPEVIADSDELIELVPEVAAEPEVAPQIAPEVAPQIAPEIPAAPLVVAAPQPPAARGRSRVMVGAGIVAALVVVADASMFFLHRRDVARRAATRATVTPPATAERPSKLPTYMVLPDHVAWPQPAPEPPAAPAIDAPAAEPPDALVVARSHRHSHHHHSRR